MEFEETDGKAEPLRDSKITMLPRDRYVEEVTHNIHSSPIWLCIVSE